MPIKRWHCSGNEKDKLKQQSAVNIQNTEDDLKILLKSLSINHFQKLLPTSIHKISVYMPGYRLIQSQYAHQKNVQYFSDLIVQLDKQASTHIS